METWVWKMLENFLQNIWKTKYEKSNNAEHFSNREDIFK